MSSRFSKGQTQEQPNLFAFKYRRQENAPHAPRPKYEFAHAALRTLKDASVIRIEDVTVELAARAARLVRYAPLRGADAIYLALAEVEDAILYTFDSEQRERGKNIVETREP